MRIEEVTAIKSEVITNYSEILSKVREQIAMVPYYDYNLSFENYSEIGNKINENILSQGGLNPMLLNFEKLMNKTIDEITLHNVFDFNKTAFMLQRGNIDPINIVELNKWERCFYYDNAVHLISVTYNKQVKIKVLHGKISQYDATKLVNYSLGLDDIFVSEQVANLPYPKKLESSIGLNIPGYPDLFEAIIQVIMGQQVSVTVANLVRARFTKALGDKINYECKDYYSFPRPENVCKHSLVELRNLGLSNTKCKAILGVADAFINDEKVHGLNLNLESDPNHIRETLTSLYGIGNWTVDWLLMRHFRRFEFIPSNDLAVRKAFTWWLDKSELVSVEFIKQFEKDYYPLGGSIAFRVLYAYSTKQNRQGDS